MSYLLTTEQFRVLNQKFFSLMDLGKITKDTYDDYRNISHYRNISRYHIMVKGEDIFVVFSKISSIFKKSYNVDDKYSYTIAFSYRGINCSIKELNLECFLEKVPNDIKKNILFNIDFFKNKF